MLKEFFDRAEKYQFRVQYTVTHVLIYSSLCRLLRGLPISDEIFRFAKESFVDVWNLARTIDPHTGKAQPESEGTSQQDAEGALQVVLAGLFMIKGLQQQNRGEYTGSAFLIDLIQSPTVVLGQSGIRILLKGLEHVAYQGMPDFAVRTMLDPVFRRAWILNASEDAVKTFANVRAFYQDEVDSLLLEGMNEQTRKGNTKLYDQNNELFNKVRNSGAKPDVGDVVFTNANLWIIATTIDHELTKFVGLIMYDLCSVDRIDAFVRRLARSMISAVFDYDVIDLALLNWWKIHFDINN